MLYASELTALAEIGKGITGIAALAEALHISDKQAYRIVRKLREKSFLEMTGKTLRLMRSPFMNLLLHFLVGYRETIPLLAGSGLPVLSATMEPCSVQDIIRKTGIKKSRIYSKLREARRKSIIIRREKKYSLNAKIWPELKELLYEYVLWEKTMDPRLPPDALIYHKSKKEIIFSTSRKMEAALTAFSAYGKYGVKVFPPREYYCLPLKKLSIKDIFIHSLYVAEHEKDIRYLLYMAVFYQHHRKSLSSIKHPLLENIKKVLAGKVMPGYPALSEVKEKIEVYAA